MKKILIIGGAGYIGSHVALEFSDAGFEVTILDNLSAGKEINILPQFKFIHCDINNRAELIEKMSGGFDAVVHLAALKAAGESMKVPGKYGLNNISGTINILDSMARNGIHKIIFSSTAAVYGDPQYLPLDEKHPVQPINFYGYTKIQIEETLKWFDQLEKIKFVALRYFNAAGYDKNLRIRGLERNPQNLIPIVLEKAIGMREELQVFGNDYKTKDGTGARDYIHVSDLASAHLRSYEFISDNNNSSDIFNLGTGESYTVLEVIQGLEKISGKEITYKISKRREGDADEIFCNSEKARKILKWEPQKSSLENILKTSWEAYTKK